ncbi:MAG: hypothetical protein GXY74_03975 [Phycisphaerae bacterium]|nr:hypothetical protein [Phycisphaerae bacterium]
MSRHAPQHEQSTNNNTVPAAPAWRRTLRRVLLLVFLFTLSTVWLTQICGCRGRLMDPEEPLKGWKLIMPDIRPSIVWAYVAMAACVAVTLVVSEPAGRTVPLVAAGRSAARIFALCVLLGTVLAVPIGMATLHWADYLMESGFHWGAGAIALAVVMELSRLARAVWMLIRQRTLRAIAPRMGPLSWALLAVNLLVLGAMGAAAAVGPVAGAAVARSRRAHRDGRPGGLGSGRMGHRPGAQPLAGAARRLLGMRAAVLAARRALSRVRPTVPDRPRPRHDGSVHGLRA